MDQIQKLLNGMGICISQYQKEMLGSILLTMEREQKDGIASEPIPLCSIHRLIAIRPSLKQLEELIG